ncbi:uncharacterized protein LOC121430494 [Lytechinus variegatus]|uniref:uncharacterized protein LOC121430494 n=1 Tax=Lytechinus variegatus TaxID=7654 RepID=UPI001BB1301C|nr:uncharacterized protein LOC121430494 [Lytechinus variegatus]
MFDQCTEKQYKNGRMVQTIPKLIPASRAEDAECRGKSKLGIRTGRRVCQFPACLSSPCENGWCEESMTGYHCHCRAGYIGKRCEDEMRKRTTSVVTPAIQPETIASTPRQTLSAISTLIGTNTSATPVRTSNSEPFGTSYSSELSLSESDVAVELDDETDCSLLSANANCPDGWIGSLVIGKCYKVENDTIRNWTDSVSYCDSLDLQTMPTVVGASHRPSLLVPESDTEQKFLRNCVFPSVRGRWYWIKCSNRTEDMPGFVCETTRNHNVSYRNWGNDQPSDDLGKACVGVRASQKWRNAKCKKRLYLLCQIYTSGI